MLSEWTSGKIDSTERVGGVKRASGGSVSEDASEIADNRAFSREVRKETKSRLVVRAGVAIIQHG